MERILQLSVNERSELFNETVTSCNRLKMRAADGKMSTNKFNYEV